MAEYVYNQIIRGERIVIDDLRKQDYAYAQQYLPETPYEVRRPGKNREQFATTKEAHEYVQTIIEELEQ